MAHPEYYKGVQDALRTLRSFAEEERHKGPNERLGDGSPDVLRKGAERVAELLDDKNPRPSDLVPILD